MAQPIFQITVEFSFGLVFLGYPEYRVVAETIITAALLYDTPLPGPLTNQWCGIIRLTQIDHHALESSSPLLAWHPI